MTRRPDPAWFWMAAAAGGAIALAVAVLAADGTGPDGIGQAVRYTARWSFLFFWPAYAGGAMAVLFGRAFAGLARRARPLGLAFAAALQVHIGLVVWLGVVIGQIPLGGGVLWFFLAALSCTYLLTLLSFGFGTHSLGRLWRPLLLVATTYILVAFGRDFVLGALDPNIRYWRYAAEYLPFALMTVIAIPLRLSAFVRRRRGPRDREPVTSASTTTEVPTFFGPPDSPLFGVLHLPADNRIRGGVLICGSLGKEGTDSAALHRTLADGLAGRGFAVLRFDYLGQGDSAHGQLRDDAVVNWVTSVGHALDYLSLIGAETTTAIGVRAGCLILQEHLRHSRRVDRVVYLDPAGTGRRYLREHTALFRLTVGENAGTPGEVTVIGGRFTDPAAAEFAALRMNADPVNAFGVGKVLVVGRPAETDKHLCALASGRGVESMTADGLPECARPRMFLAPIPFTAIEAITDWIDAHGPVRIHDAVPRYRTAVTMPADEPGGADVVERIERVGPDGLFAIRALPRRGGPPPAKTVLFFVTAKDSHIGPAREWVESARCIAAAGSQALRWDPAGLGLSDRIGRDPWRFVYAKADIADSITMARHACREAGELEVVGVCSGSWYAAHTARDIGARSAILVNHRPWNWRVTPTLLSQWDARRKALYPDAAVDTGSGPSASRLARVKALLNAPREPMKSWMHDHLPRHLLRVLGWVGLLWLPDAVLPTLARRGVDVTLIASPDDVEELTCRGGRATLERLHGSPQPPRMIAAPIGDHSAFHPAILAAIRDAIVPVNATSVRDQIRGEVLLVSAQAARAGRP